MPHNHQGPYPELNKTITIRFLTTGGTIDKTYDEREGTLENRESAVKEWILGELRLPYHEIFVHSIMSKDSLFMTTDDRKLIAEAIEETMAKGDAIVVLHGTDTLDQTLQYCDTHIPSPTVPIVFTGAMRPLEFSNSDALQNVVEAMMAAQCSPPGFYLAFHGRLFKGSGIRKNRAIKTFEAIERQS